MRSLARLVKGNTPVPNPPMCPMPRSIHTSFTKPHIDPHKKPHMYLKYIKPHCPYIPTIFKLSTTIAVVCPTMWTHNDNTSADYAKNYIYGKNLQMCTTCKNLQQSEPAMLESKSVTYEDKNAN